MLIFGFLFSDIKSESKGNLPRPEDFSKALYTLDIGQNDLAHALGWMTVEQVQASIPNITQKFASAVEVQQTLMDNVCHKLVMKKLYQLAAGSCFWYPKAKVIFCSQIVSLHF